MYLLEKNSNGYDKLPYFKIQEFIFKSIILYKFSFYLFKV